MRVYITHAETDRAAAANLREALTASGMGIVETNTDEDSFPSLETEEGILAVLWSASLAASENRLQVEAFMLSAWADQRLVLFNLDSTEFPLGFRDDSFPKADVRFARGEGFGSQDWTEKKAQAAYAIRHAFNRLELLKNAQRRINNFFDHLIAMGSDRESAERARDRMNDLDSGLIRWQDGGYKGAEEKSFLVLFVSYCHANREKVDRIVKIIQDSGWAVWIDRKDLAPGDDWAGKIVRAIKRAKGVMWVGSKDACKSDDVKREIYLTGRYKKPLAPVLLEKTRMPDWLEYFVAGVQWLPLYELPDESWPEAIRGALARMERRE